MDDLQFWLYVILGVVYLISQVRKKSKQQQNLPPEKPIDRDTTSTEPQWKTETQRSSGQKPISFEELLREIAESKSIKNQPEYETHKQPEYIDYDDNLPDEIQDLEDLEVDHTKNDPVFKKYNEAKNRDYSGYSMEDSRKLESVDMKFGKFKEFEVGAQLNLLDLYLSDLRGPEGMKKAVILNEVLNPKYF